MNAQSTIYEQITSVIIEAIEEGCGKCEMPWHSTLSSPCNALNGRRYRGINLIVLWSICQRFRYATNLWGTFQQWSQLGAQVRKGSKATKVVFWKVRDGESEDSDNETSNSKSHCFAKAYHVFNAEQVENFTAPIPATLSEEERIQNAEKFFKNTGAVIEERGSIACYDVCADKIYMPPFTHFKKAAGFYTTLGHELTHWTGASARLNRDIRNRFRTEAYAAEELIAELGSAFLSAELGLTSEPRSDHAPYINGWLSLLKQDNRAIFTAASYAQRAVDWLVHLSERSATIKLNNELAKL